MIVCCLACLRHYSRKSILAVTKREKISQIVFHIFPEEYNSYQIIAYQAVQKTKKSPGINVLCFTFMHICASMPAPAKEKVLLHIDHRAKNFFSSVM